ncbi:MAG: ABC transporter substrate-binding protein [Acidiferrobacteraceae bacterium]
MSPLKMHRVLLKSLLAIGLLGVAANSEARTIAIRIGHQSMCTDTYPGGVVIKNLHLLQKFLPTTGRYQGVHYHIVWRDYSSGAPITNMMIANKLDFGVMGDYPLVVNGAKFQALRGERSLLVSGTAYNADGAGNGIVVPTSSGVYTLRGLEGKTIGVPVGSAAWGMLYKAAQDAGLKITDFHIANQSPMAGITSIAANKVAAHADFCPMSEYMEYKGTGRMIYSGAETGVPYLHGVVVRQAFARRYPAVVVAYLEALITADRWIAANPLRAARLMSKWTMIPKEVLYLYYSKGGYLTPDPTLKPQWVKTLAYDHSILARYSQVGPLDFGKWVQDGYLRTAYRKLGLNYDRQLGMIYQQKHNIHRDPEIWVKHEGIKRYPDVQAMIVGLSRLKAAGKTINTSYVYDAHSGLKLFGTVSFFVRAHNRIVATYMRRDEAQRAAAHLHGAVLDYAQAVALHTAVLARPIMLTQAKP